MDLNRMAASFFLCGDNISEDLHKLCEAADNQAAIPEDVIVWYPFENENAETLEEYIFNLEQMLMEVRYKTISQMRLDKKINHE
jgi:hypothetical protein